MPQPGRHCPTLSPCKSSDSTLDNLGATLTDGLVRRNSSLQEVAPLSYSFIGAYFLNPYYARYEEALNLASARLLEAKALPSDGSQASPRPTPRPYTLVRAKNVGMTAILLFARDPTHIHKIEEAERGFGAADMGNKGAVGLRVTWSDAPNGATTPATEVTLVATHLAAMEWNLKKRNANWRTIVSGLTFANPRDILPGPFPADTSAPRPDQSGAGDTNPRPSSTDDDDDNDDTQALLPTAPTNSLSESDLAALQATSIFKPTSHLFLFGDLNYRISTTTPPPLADFPSFDPSSPNYFPAFLPRDQLTQERLAGRTFHGLSEPPITFGPTYKFDVLPDYTAEEATNAAAVRAGATQNGIPEVPWRFAPHRWPGWCDRVLFLDEGVEVRAYDALPVVRSSDHRAVFLRAAVAPLREGAVVTRREGDPRVEMPVQVDVHAWERRAAARRKELVVGWTAFFWSTREGAVVMATVMVVVVGGWWVWGLA